MVTKENLKRINLTLGIDLSGKPPETIYIGLISMNIYSMNKIIEDFKETYPEIWNIKGKNLTHKNLYSIIDYFQSHDARMATIRYTVNDWFFLHQFYKEKAHLEAKMLGILYYELIRKVSFPGITANIVTCTESGINIIKIHETIQKIAYSQNRIFTISHGLERFNPIIKIADYVATASRKLKASTLKEFSHYYILSHKKIPVHIYKKIIQ